MRSYVDSFDTRVTAKAGEVTSALEQRLGRFSRKPSTAARRR